MLPRPATETNRFSLRPATAGDASAAARIIANALAEHALPFEPEGRDADVATFGASLADRNERRDFVAEVDGAVVGVVSIGAQGDDARLIAWVSKLFVEKRVRGRGIGRALLHAAHDAARAEGFEAVGLRTRTLFREALALYASEGYVARGDPRALEEGDVVLYRAL
jgi:GNAT superfamily N-acetyltransferase